MMDYEMERKAEERKRTNFQDDIARCLSRHSNLQTVLRLNGDLGTNRVGVKVIKNDLFGGTITIPKGPLSIFITTESIFLSTKDTRKVHISCYACGTVVTKRLRDLTPVWDSLTLQPAQCAVAEIKLVITAHGSEVRVSEFNDKHDLTTVMSHRAGGRINKITTYKEAFQSTRYLVARDMGLLELIDSKRLEVFPVVDFGPNIDIKDALSY